MLAGRDDRNAPTVMSMESGVANPEVWHPLLTAVDELTRERGVESEQGANRVSW